MTATTIPAPTTRPASRRTGASLPPRGAPVLQRWAADRRRRRYRTEKRRYDARDRSDRYLDRTDDAHQRQALVAFVQR